MELHCDIWHPVADTPLPLSTLPFQMSSLSAILSGIPSPCRFLNLASLSCGEVPLSLPALPEEHLGALPPGLCYPCGQVMQETQAASSVMEDLRPDPFTLSFGTSVRKVIISSLLCSQQRETGSSRG